MMLPKTYKATSTVMLDVRTPDLLGGVVAGVLTPSYMATQVDLIASERVVRKAVKALKLDETAALRDQWRDATQGQGDYQAWVAERLGASLDIKPARESNVITVGYESADPRFSAAMTNAVVQAYIDTTVEMRADPSRRYNAFFDTRAKELREAIEAAQAKLSSYQRGKGLLATEERMDVENARLAELSSQVVALQAVTAESSGRVAQAGVRPEQMPEVLSNSVVAALSAEVAREDVRVQEMSLRMGANHPNLISARTQLAELRSRLAEATQRASGTASVNNNVNHARLAQVKASLEAQRAKVLELKAVRDEAAVLTRDVEHAQRAFDAVTTRMNQTSLESQNTQSNILVLKSASTPSDPASPNVRRNLFVAAFLSVMLGILTALVREALDRRLRSARDVVEDLHQTLLVTLPSVNAARLERAGTPRLGFAKVRGMANPLRRPRENARQEAA